MPADENMILRTVYLPRDLDQRLKGIAFRLSKSKNELIRDLIAIGLQHHPTKPFGEDTPIALSDTSNVRFETVGTPKTKARSKPAALAGAD